MFQTSYYLTEEGNYILEINSDEGGAVLNQPIYVYTAGRLGPGIPLVPDF